MTDMITVSRSEIEKLQTTWVDGGYYINKDTLLNLLDKAEKSQVEPVAYRWGNDAAWLLTEEMPVSCDSSVLIQRLYTSPPADKQHSCSAGVRNEIHHLR